MDQLREDVFLLIEEEDKEVILLMFVKSNLGVLWKMIDWFWEKNGNSVMETQRKLSVISANIQMDYFILSGHLN